jgi:FkbM family methyltransferase
MNATPLIRISFIRGIVHLLVKLQNRFVIFAVTYGFRGNSSTHNLVRLGTFYGGWWIPKEYLTSPKNDLVVVSAGLGYDVSFDQAIVESGHQVIGLDPLVQCVELANQAIKNPELFKTINAGLWIEDGSQTFFAPRVSGSDAWSATNSQNTNAKNVIEFPVVSMQTLFLRYPQIEQSKYSYLKMDIEGAEGPILESLDFSSLPFTLIGVEMDFLSLISLKDLAMRIRMIKRARLIMMNLESTGYNFIQNENFNFFWIKKV